MHCCITWHTYSIERGNGESMSKLVVLYTWTNSSYICNRSSYFSVRLLSVLRGHSFISSPPQRPMTSDFEEFLYQVLIINYIIFLSYFLKKSQYFPFQWWVLNKGTTGTIMISSLLRLGPWLGSEPGTSRTRSQHSTTRLSRRRYNCYISCEIMNISS